MARWERKQKHTAQDKHIRTVLKRRKHQRKQDRGIEQILRYLPDKRVGKQARHAIEQLWAVAYRLKFAKPQHLSRPGYIERDNPYLFALARIAERHDMWLRDPAGFKTRTYNIERQFSELIRYLFTRFDPPAFLEQSWFEADRKKAQKQQTWYIRLGRGDSARRLTGVPIEMSKRTAHLLAKVPPNFTVEQGLRWAQTRGMGASPATAEALLASPIGTDFKRDAFWLTVIRFLIDQPMLDPNAIGPIVDYIHFQRHQPQHMVDHQPQHMVDANGRYINEPAQPNFSMKGRSIRRLMAQVEQWHGRLAQRATGQRYLRWTSSGIPGQQWVEGVGKSKTQYVIRELLDSVALASEGERMRHCVGSYAATCHSGHAAIFSLSAMKQAKVLPLLTIEVRVRNRAIVQARGACNVRASTDQLRMLRNWAQQADLQVAEWV